MKITAYRIVLAVVAASLAGVASAKGFTLETDFTSKGEFASPGSFEWNFVAPKGAGTMDFRLVGYDSLDGSGAYDGWYDDVFHLKVNGKEIFVGSFNMGGIGNDVIFFNPNGATVSTTNYGFFNGGFSQISLPLVLDHDGEQNMVFSYSGNLQIPDDETWGVGKVTLNIPEPEAFSTLLPVLGYLGFSAFRRKRLSA